MEAPAGSRDLQHLLRAEPVPVEDEQHEFLAGGHQGVQFRAAPLLTSTAFFRVEHDAEILFISDGAFTAASLVKLMPSMSVEFSMQSLVSRPVPTRLRFSFGWMRTTMRGAAVKGRSWAQ